MKFTIIFLLSLIAYSTIAIDISDIESLELLAMDSADAFDDVLTLFDQLEVQSRGELQTLQEDWVQQGGQLQQTCQITTGLSDEKQGEVDTQQGVVDGLQDDATSIQNHIDFIDQRYLDNSAKLEIFKQKRCDANLQFIQHLTDHKHSLQAIRVLLEIIENMTEDDIEGYEGSLFILADLNTPKHSQHQVNVLNDIYIKIKSIFNLMPNELQTSFVELGSKLELQQPNNNYEVDDEALDAEEQALADERLGYGEGYDYETDTHERTGDEIGTDHLDDEFGTFEITGQLESGYRHGFAELQQGILTLLQDLEVHLAESIEQMTEDEIGASSAFADWKMLTESEEVELTAELENQQNQLVDLNVIIAEEEANLQELGVQLVSVQLQATTACNAQDTAEQQFQDREQNKLEEIDNFAEIRWRYEQMAEGLTDQMVNRVNQGVNGQEMIDFN